MGWDSEGNISKVLTDNITLGESYYLDAKGNALSSSRLSVKFNEFMPVSDQNTDGAINDDDKVASSNELDYTDVIKTDANTNIKSLGIKELKATATATVATVTLQPATTGGSAVDEPITVKHEFKVKLTQQFDGAKIVYFNDGVKEDKASVVANGAISNKDFIQSYYKSENGTNGAPDKYTGLAIEYNGKYIPVANNTFAIDNYTIDNDYNSTIPPYTLKYDLSLAPGSQGNNPQVDTNGVKFGSSTTEVGQGGKLEFKFTDSVGLNYKAEIEYVKTNAVIDRAQSIDDSSVVSE